MVKRKGKVALHSTILSGNTDLIKDLLKEVVDVNQLDERNNTPLHIAAMKGYTEIISILLKKGANPNLKNKHNSTPLHFAVQLNHVDAAMLLINNKSDVNAKDRYSETPLHFAVANDNLILAKALIEEGAKVNSTNSQFLTALAIAENNNNDSMISYLESKDALAPKGFIETAKIAFKSANMYRKVSITLFVSIVLAASGMATIMSGGKLAFAFIMAIVASAGFSVICLEKPYRRIKNLESKVLNGVMTQDEVNLLLCSKEISVSNNEVATEQIFVNKATNDNLTSGKLSGKKELSQNKALNNR